MCTAGAGTQATTDADDKLKDALGGLAYLVTGLSKLPELEARPIEVQTPDFAWSGQIWNASIGNGRQAGGGWCLCPLAQIDDGLLDLMLLPRLSETRWGRILK
jgi:diacylglycerol kinase family enzyme